MSKIMEDKIAELGRPEFTLNEGQIVSWNAFFESTGQPGRIGLMQPTQSQTYMTAPGGEVISLSEGSGPLSIEYTFGPNGQTTGAEIVLVNPGDLVRLPSDVQVKLNTSNTPALFLVGHVGAIALTRKRGVDHISHLANFLLPNDHLANGSIVTTKMLQDRTNIDYDIVPITNPSYSPNDRVLLDIRPYSNSKEMILRAGNPLEIEVLAGIGTLTTTEISLENDIELGKATHTALKRGERVDIKAGTVFQYSATSSGLVVRDTCIDFEPRHEMPFADFVGIQEFRGKAQGLPR